MISTLVGRVTHPCTGRQRTLWLPIQIAEEGDASIDWSGKIHGKAVVLRLATELGKAWLVTLIRDTLKTYGLYYRDSAT